jgi:hypothetical protein
MYADCEFNSIRNGDKIQKFKKNYEKTLFQVT